MFSDTDCDAFLQRMKLHADGDFAAILNMDRLDFLSEQAPFSSEDDICETNRLMRNLMGAPRLVSVLETLQGNEVVGLMSQMLFKEAGSKYAGQAWNPHQDNSYPRNENKQYLTINLFLADSDMSNGTLYIYPGSHKEDILPYKPVVSYREQGDEIGTNPGNDVEVPTQYEKVDVEFKKGDTFILHGNVIHGSYANESPDRSRPLIQFTYITKGEDFIPGNTAKRMAISLH